MKMELRGAGTALVTPFDERGKIDFGAIESLVEWQIAEGTDFLVSCTPEGESPALSGDERKAVTAHLVAVANGRVPVVAGAGGNHTAKSVFWARDAEKAGASAILAVNPFYNMPTVDGLARHFAAICDATRLPVLVSNAPARTGIDLGVEVLLRLADLPRVAGLVECSTDFRKIAALLARAPEEFAVFSGDDLTALAGLALGMRGTVSLAGNLVPGEMSRLVKAASQDQREEARSLHRKYAGLMEVLHVETSPGPAKAALAMMNRCGETLRLPLAPVRDDSRRRIEKTLRGLRLLKDPIRRSRPSRTGT
ncbi:MAG: 4-hydroxy-tetrahydrodipicolinate synthase [Thermoanaerobaculia bacterium]